MAVCATKWAFSQDLIVTLENDSITCKITQITSDNIYFTFLVGDGIKKNILPKEMVKSYHYGYYTDSKKEKDFSTYRIALQGGFSYLLEKIDPDLEQVWIDLNKKLKKGFNATAAISYYFTPYIGVGLNGSFFSSKASMTGLYWILEDGTQGENFDLTEKIKFYYIAPHFAGRLPVMDNKGTVIMNASVGFAYYHDKVLMSTTFDVKKPTIASGIDIGYDFNIGESFAIGVMASFLICVFKIEEALVQNKVMKLEEPVKNNMSRIDLTIGLRFR